ncbi:MAG: hypothetical protein J1D88_05360 [Treponema sp.]|nr:hypothetical protein [Treponema sp.]
MPKLWIWHARNFYLPHPWRHTYVRFFTSFILTSIIEYFTSRLLEKLFHAKRSGTIPTIFVTLMAKSDSDKNQHIPTQKQSSRLKGGFAEAQHVSLPQE